GTGKTTIARLVALAARAAFEELSAVEAGRAEVRAVLERAAHRRAATGEATVFFLDEIHRFNKAQQDALLPAVEEGLVVLIGATTENPYFEVNSALLSRTHVYELEPLSAADLETLHRPADDRARLGGRRQRRPAGAAGRGRRRPRGRPRRDARVRACTRPGRDLPLAGAEIQRRLPRDRRRPRPHPRARRAAAAPAPALGRLPGRKGARAR